MKWYGKIGFEETVEEVPGVYVEKICARPYFGDLIRNLRRLDNSDYLNDDVNISNEISVLADQYAYHNFHTMRYVEFMGSKWKITSVEVQPPRLILSIGGLYNGEDSSKASVCS